MPGQGAEEAINYSRKEYLIANIPDVNVDLPARSGVARRDVPTSRATLERRLGRDARFAMLVAAEP